MRNKACTVHLTVCTYLYFHCEKVNICHPQSIAALPLIAKLIQFSNPVRHTKVTVTKTKIKNILTPYNLVLKSQFPERFFQPMNHFMFQINGTIHLRTSTVPRYAQPRSDRTNWTWLSYAKANITSRTGCHLFVDVAMLGRRTGKATNVRISQSLLWRLYRHIGGSLSGGTGLNTKVSWITKWKREKKLDFFLFFKKKNIWETKTRTVKQSRQKVKKKRFISSWHTI